MIGIKDQYFGTEIEMTGITRQRAAEVVAEMFGTEAYYDGTTYGVWSVIDLEGKRLNHKFCGISDSSRSSVGSYRIASERNIRHQDIRIPVCEES